MYDRAQHKEGECQSEQGQANDNIERGAGCGIGSFYHETAFFARGLADPLHQVIQRFIHLGAVRASASQQGVSDHAIAIGIGVGRLHRLAEISFDFGANRVHGIGIVIHQFAEADIKPCACGFGLTFGENQLAYRQVG